MLFNLQVYYIIVYRGCQPKLIYFSIKLTYNKYCMECKFLSNGIALQYHNFLKPCCAWQADEQWVTNHNIQSVDIINWHRHPDLVSARKQLADGNWPKSCQNCQMIESQGRGDSVRLNGASAYSHYLDSDITLEIRPGNVCNFACQTCWTPASTRVMEFYRRAELDDPYKNYVKNDLIDFNLLMPIKDRLKNIIVLGGEPFYDPKCLEFWQWAIENTSADLLVFTNGSVLKPHLFPNTGRNYTLVFSLDAVGKPAEYIRYGTNWPKVLEHFKYVQQELQHVELRVNITTSVYNFLYFPDVIDLLLDHWPNVVSFGVAGEEQFIEEVIPLPLRQRFIDRLTKCANILHCANIELGQKQNAVNAVTSIISNLKNKPYEPTLHAKFVDYVRKMDQVKAISFAEHCPELADLLDFPNS